MAIRPVDAFIAVMRSRTADPGSRAAPDSAESTVTSAAPDRRAEGTVPDGLFARAQEMIRSSMSELLVEDPESTHDDPTRTFRPASGVPLVSHHWSPSDGLLGAEPLTVTLPPPMRVFTTWRLATPAREPTAFDRSPRMTSIDSVGVMRLEARLRSTAVRAMRG